MMVDEATYALLSARDKARQQQPATELNSVSIRHRAWSALAAVADVFSRTLTAYLLLAVSIAVIIILLVYPRNAPTSLRASRLPTLYEHYTSGGISEGLVAGSSAGFTLNGRAITLYSGAIHYFRVHPDYWRDRLRKARAAGLNAVETYVPWNLHEPRMGEFDFGAGGNDLSLLLDVRRFLQMAQEEDLLVILRPGPYICSEWEFGGLPSWLLRYEGIEVRTSDSVYTSHVRQYFAELLPRLANLTFVKGGPVVAVQIENEYGSFVVARRKKDPAYLALLLDLHREHAMHALFFTSDAPAGSKDYGSIPGVLQTANFAGRADRQFEVLRQLQPDKPLMAMEFWTGWFDHWMQTNREIGNPPFVFAAVLTSIFSYNASVNFYMFHGGTTFGFMNGANVKAKFPVYEPDVSSYDYVAPLSEAGDFTEKYRIAQALIAANNPVRTLLPAMPAETAKRAYPSVPVTEYLPILDLFEQVPLEDRISGVQIGESSSSMEMLPVENNNGQSYGVTVYRKLVQPAASSASLQIMGHVRDIALVLVDGQQRTKQPVNQNSTSNFGFWPARDAALELEGLTPETDMQLDILVENAGRVNFGGPSSFLQKKGLWEGPVLFDGQELLNWTVLAMHFKGSWVHSLRDWKRSPGPGLKGPAMFRAQFTVSGPPADSFLDMRAWGKGFLFLNGFPLGRYFNLGPQLTSFLPAPLLRQGNNEIVIFEQYMPASHIIFSDTPNLGKPRNITAGMAF